VRQLHLPVTAERSGRTGSITQFQQAAICALAEQAPYELGLPYGRWSLRKLRDYLVAERIVATLSREHLRRLLKKGALPSDECSAKSSAMTRSVKPF